MKILSNIITEQDMTTALTDASIQGVYVDVRRASRGRNTKYSYDVQLHAQYGHDLEGTKRRPKNSGVYGADYRMAATYSEHGWWMVQLFKIDPTARISYYHGVDDFHTTTQGQFRADRVAS